MPAIYIRRNGELCFSGRDPKVPRNGKGACNAKTRKGTSCKAPPVWDKSRDEVRNGRCKLHGGLSTGPKTEVGREAIRLSNQRRANVAVIDKSSNKIDKNR